MNENPWKSPDDLRFERQNPKFGAPPSSAMARGTRLEPVARAAYVARTKIQVRPLCIQSTGLTWMRCSLDGISIEEQKLVEIKCGKSAYRHTARHKSPPIYYYGQLQHIMSVSEFESIDFWCYEPSQQPILINVCRDEPYIKRLIDAEQAFWESIRDHL